MQKPGIIIIGITFIVLSVIGIGITSILRARQTKPIVLQEEQADVTIPAADSSIEATVARHGSKDSTVVLTISGLKGQYASILYELSYESKGIVQGVTSRPLDVAGKDTFIRDDIYLGTCSKNVCRPHAVVRKVFLVLEFTDTNGKISQLAKDFDL